MVDLEKQLSVLENAGRELHTLLDFLNDALSLAIANETPEIWDSLSVETDRVIEKLCEVRSAATQGVVLMENSGE